jgi:DNA polymerase
MSPFDQALDYLHDSLLQLRSQGRENLVASRESLGRLLAAKPAPTPDKSYTTDRTYSSEPAQGAKAERMATLRQKALACSKCPHLVASRTQVVFGVGNLDAEIMFVGEAPGADEDLQGEPFVGKAGQLLTKIIAAMGLSREEVYIGNVLKCRPDMPPGDSGNRKPRPEEMETCLPYLKEQIQIVRPKVLVALGATAMQGLTGSTLPMNQLRGRWHQFEQIPLMATYHPSYLLRNQAISEKRKVWEDMLMVMERLAMPISEKQRSFFKQA